MSCARLGEDPREVGLAQEVGLGMLLAMALHLGRHPAHSGREEAVGERGEGHAEWAGEYIQVEVGTRVRGLGLGLLMEGLMEGLVGTC